MTAAEPRRVLIATVGATSRSGTDLYTRDLALALLRHGWQPVVYATVLGAVAEELRKATIPVTADITQIAATPHVIHGHHHLQTLAALARFPGVPALFVCHDGLTWHSVPPRTPRIGAYVAVDRNCRDRMMLEHGIPEGLLHIMTNAVDLRRFRRRPPLPARPQRALVFSNQATPNNFAATISAACLERGLSLDILGLSAGNATEHPEDVLPQYDIVFAKARCALEAAAAGCAVIDCDSQGLAGMITARDLDPMRQLNFGTRLLQRPITRETIGAEIDRYDPEDAANVADALRDTGGTDQLAENFIRLYEELSRTPVTMTPEEELRATAESLSRLVTQIQVKHQPPSSIRNALRRSRVLGAPVRLLYQLRERFRRAERQGS
jgi:hypothetical protein